MYDDIVDEGVPERFVELLKRLDGSDDNGGGDNQRRGLNA
jgi:hypothetical protein